MDLTLLKCKIHRATVTEAELDYTGSIMIDAVLMKAAGLVEHEQVDIYNITNGERLTTYVIKGESNSGIIGINGAAAHKASVGDHIIIAAYAHMDKAEAEQHEPKVIFVDEANRIIDYGRAAA